MYTGVSVLGTQTGTDQSLIQRWRFWTHTLPVCWGTHVNPRGHPRTVNTYMTQERAPSSGEHMSHMSGRVHTQTNIVWGVSGHSRLYTERTPSSVTPCPTEPQRRTPSIDAHVLWHPIWTREDTLERWTHIRPKSGHPQLVNICHIWAREYTLKRT